MANIIKVRGNLTKDELEELVHQLNISHWTATDKNVTFEVIEDGS
jgi:hypothetical protein